MKTKLFIFSIFSIFMAFNACKKEKDIPAPVLKITYNKDVKAIFVASCTPCHLAGGANPNKWDDYTMAKNKIVLILDRVNREPAAAGFMPKGGTKLPAATIAILNKWVTDGTLEK